MSFFVSVIVAVMIIPVGVICGVKVRVLTDVVAHIDISVSVRAFRVVVERNGRERVEDIGVHNTGFSHAIVLCFIRSLVSCRLPWFHYVQVESTSSRVTGKMGSVGHSSEYTHSV